MKLLEAISEIKFVNKSLKPNATALELLQKYKKFIELWVYFGTKIYDDDEEHNDLYWDANKLDNILYDKQYTNYRISPGVTTERLIRLFLEDEHVIGNEDWETNPNEEEDESKIQYFLKTYFQ